LTMIFAMMIYLKISDALRSGQPRAEKDKAN